MIRCLLLLLLAQWSLGCCKVSPPEETSSAPINYVHLYARLHESQAKETAEAQYLPNLTKALANYDATIRIEEIRGAEKTIEFIGIKFVVAAPETEADTLESLLMDTFRLSGAPYATQIFIVVP